MTRKSRVVVFGIGVVTILGFIAWQIAAKVRYDQLRQKLDEGVRFTARALDGDAAAFLDSVRSSWKLQSQECPDPIFAQISSVTGLGQSVEGVVELYTHEVPAFSFFDHRRNVEEGVMTITLATALPASADQLIYTGEGIAFVKISEKCVEVFEDTTEGLSRSLYFEPADGDGGGSPGEE